MMALAKLGGAEAATAAMQNTGDAKHAQISSLCRMVPEMSTSRMGILPSQSLQIGPSMYVGRHACMSLCTEQISNDSDQFSRHALIGCRIS